MPKNHNREQDIKIAEIGTDVKWIKTEISNIKDNHLKSIYNKLEAQKTWLVGLLGVLIMTLIGTILNLLK